MFHTVYKTTNLVNGKYYIGVHKTENPNDEYLGSGKLLWRAIEKYGWQNFKKEVLFTFETPEEAFKKEEELVDEARKDPNCYNLRKGGAGGFDFCNKLPTMVQDRSNAGKLGVVKAKENLIFRETMCKFELLETYRRDPRNAIKIKKNALAASELGVAAWKGKHHSEEFCNIQSERQSGERNSNFGTCWIHNHCESRKIKRIDLDFWIELGWNLGRLRTWETTASNKGKIWIHRANQSKAIPPEDFPGYAEQGWKLGRGKYSNNADVP